MRNTTKLKAVLQHYHIDLFMEDKETITLTLFHKVTGESIAFSDPSYSKLVAKAYGHCQKNLSKKNLF